MVDLDKLSVFPAFDNFGNDIEIICDGDRAIILLKRDAWLGEEEGNYILRLCVIINHEFIHWIIYLCGVEENYDEFLKELGIYNIDGFMENWM